jgi:hypothetical protein
MGSSTSGLIDVYSLYLPFVHYIKHHQRFNDAQKGLSLTGQSPSLSLSPIESTSCRDEGEKRRIYAVVVDVKHAFDTINRNKLMNIIANDIFVEDRYCIERYSGVKLKAGIPRPIYSRFVYPADNIMVTYIHIHIHTYLHCHQFFSFLVGFPYICK